MDNTPLIIDLLRHGETEAGARFIGSTDAVLTTAGRAQMQWVDQYRYDAVISSPLKRCAEFAHSVHSSPQIIDDLREMHFGDWENQSSETLWQQEREKLSAFWNNPMQNTPPAAESLADFNHRISTVFQRIIRQNTGKKILLISHSGVIRSVLSYVLEMPPANIQRLQITHGSLSRIEITRSDNDYFFRVLFTNLLAENLQ